MFNLAKYQEIKKIIKKQGKKTEIIAISKNQSLNHVEEAVSNNLTIFGENRVQEAVSKFSEILKNNKTIKLHLTGPLQTNKTKIAIDVFDTFHTLDREKLLREFSKYSEKLKNKEFFIQVNTGKESTKSGIYPENVESFYKLCLSYGIKNIRGLMCIPPVSEDPKKHFSLIEKIRKDLDLGGLSIGMSSDYLDAIAFDPIYIRIGTALFGKRL